MYKCVEKGRAELRSRPFFKHIYIKLEVEVVGSQIDQVTAEIIQPDFDPSRQFLDWKEIEEQIPVV